VIYCHTYLCLDRQSTHIKIRSVKKLSSALTFPWFVVACSQYIFIKEKRLKDNWFFILFCALSEAKGMVIKINVLIEVKVHDYISVKSGQIETYYEAAKEELGSDNVYFIFLTQFNKNNFPTEKDIGEPNSIIEFEKIKKDIPDKKIKHLNWEELYKFIDPYKDNFPPEYIHILKLQKTWMAAKSKEDIELNKIDVGIRGLSSYFSDMSFEIEDELDFGKIVNKDNKKILSIDLEQCSPEQLNKILNIIKTFSNSSEVDQKIKQITNEDTLTAAKKFLTSLSENENSWQLLSFYSSLFDFVNDTDYLLLNGTGTRGFSIKVIIKKKGTISLCTLWSNKKIEFSIKR